MRCPSDAGLYSPNASPHCAALHLATRRHRGCWAARGQCVVQTSTKGASGRTCCVLVIQGLDLTEVFMCTFLTTRSCLQTRRQDYCRTGRFMLYGFLIHAPGCHYFYQLLDRYAPRRFCKGTSAAAHDHCRIRVLYLPGFPNHTHHENVGGHHCRC